MYTYIYKVGISHRYHLSLRTARLMYATLRACLPLTIFWISTAARSLSCCLRGKIND